MSIAGLFTGPTSGQVSSVPNPFARSSVYRVDMNIGSWNPGGDPLFRAVVHVQIGRTKGEHEVTGRDYPDLMTNLTAMLEGLPS